MLPMRPTAIWDEVQGDCEPSRLRRALEGIEKCTSLVLDGWTPLHYVCENRGVGDTNRADAIRELINWGVDANAADEQGWTALHLLCKNKNTEERMMSLQALLRGRLNAQLVTKDGGRTALHLLCANEAVTPSALSELLKVTTDVNTPDEDGNTALHFLSENPLMTVDLLRAMLSAKAAPNVFNQFKTTPFHSVCQSGQISTEAVRLMLAHNADPNAHNDIGNTAFHFACENYRVTAGILEEFVKCPRVNVTLTNSLGKTAMQLLPAHKADCIEIAQRYTSSFLGMNSSVSLSQASATVGGEDVSELPLPLVKPLSDWNASLPPFDMAFYNAICCEPAFAKMYEEVQDVSLRVSESPSSATLVNTWEASLAKWRGRVVLAYAALISPSLWDAYSEKYKRPIPADLRVKLSNVTQIWQRFPDAAQRRERLELLSQMF